MAKIFTFFLAALCTLSLMNMHAQDTLPKFTVKNIGNNRVIISWIHTYQLVKQISIQRSFDSVKNFTTILNVTDPMARQNGYVDTKAPTDHMFYRLFIALDRGMFFFSKTKSPEIDTVRKVDVSKVDKLIIVDSVVYPDYDEVNGIKRHELFIPSIHVYTHRDGYVRINLPEVTDKKYQIKFYNEDNTFLFELKDIKETYLTLDKAVFYHSGWFKFELYEEGKIIEKHKFYLPKEF
jgi:hypothetical protein